MLAFDEPLGALDALTRISMQRLLERVWNDQAFTAILVTHDVAEAVALADRVLVIERGTYRARCEIDIARPRRRGSADLAALEGSILRNLLSGSRRRLRTREAKMNLVARNLPAPREIAPGEFRNAMRHLAGGVSVITAGRGGDISGMTVTSVSSLAIEPPTLIVAINRKASTLPLLRRYGAFGVNILSGDQVDIAERFTGKDGRKGAERFGGSSWTAGPSGVPLLKDALVVIGCEVEEIIERHSHAIVLGRVVHLATSEASAALAYWRGEYLAIARDSNLSRISDIGLPTDLLKT